MFSIVILYNFSFNLVVGMFEIKIISNEFGEMKLKQQKKKKKKREREL